MRIALTVTLALLLTAPVQAGLYYSGEPLAELPSQWRGFLLDQRTLRTLAAPANVPNALRESYIAERDRLTKLSAERALTSDEAADLGALQLRLGNAGEALAVLRSTHAAHPDHFHVAANLGAAWQMNGELDQAAAALRDAVRLAPPKRRPLEELHLKLVTQRQRQPKGSQALDDLFGIRFIGADGKYAAGGLAEAERAKLPADAVSLAQQLALALPADGRMLWQLGELANAYGDIRTAAAILDGCVSEFGLRDPELRSHRSALRAAADELSKNKPVGQGDAQTAHDQHQGLTFRTTRPLTRRFDASRLPAVRPEGLNTLPWPILSLTTIDRNSRPTFHKHLRELDGKRVAVSGYLQPIGDELDSGMFLLIEYPIGCWFCEVPEPTGIVLLELPEGKSAMLTRNQVKVTGRLALNSTDPENFLYTVRDAVIAPPD